MRRVRAFLGTQAVAFATAALAHGGVFLDGYQHREASIAESVIAAVLALGLVVSLAGPGVARAAALGSQGFALLGTLVGITMIAIGVGPQSVFDLLLHAGFVALLVAGLAAAARLRTAASARRMTA